MGQCVKCSGLHRLVGVRNEIKLQPPDHLPHVVTCTQLVTLMWRTVCDLCLCCCLLQACVALMLKQPALIGLDTDELRVRLAALSEAVGCDKPDAARLVAAAAELVMMHPDYVKVSTGHNCCVLSRCAHSCHDGLKLSLQHHCTWSEWPGMHDLQFVHCQGPSRMLCLLLSTKCDKGGYHSCGMAVNVMQWVV